jgi:mannose-1-phosphate guanylyltransferase
MVLAAGLGTRMAPLSAHYAKPVLPVLDEPLLLRLARALAEQGVERLVVNAHARADQVREVARRAPLPVDVCFEPELLGSGGGVRGAREFLDDGRPFLVLNADMCLRLDVAALLRVHRSRGALATLLVRDEPRKHAFGSLGYTEDGRVRRITDRIDLGGEKISGLFAGVQVMSAEIFEHMPAGGVFGLMERVYEPALRAGACLAACEQDPAEPWWPVGTPRELLDVNLDALERATAGLPGGLLVHASAQIEGELVGPAWVGAGVHVPAGCRVGPRVVLGAGATLAPPVCASDTLFLPGAQASGRAALHRAVVFDEEIWSDG